MAGIEPINQSFSEMVQPLKAAVNRYISVVWAPALAIGCFLLIVAFALPSYYLSQVTISVQHSKLSTKVVDNQTKEEQIEKLNNLVLETLSRPSLLSIIDKFKLYPHYVGIRGKENALKKLRENLLIESAVSTTGEKLSQTFVLKFSHESPQTAYEVANELSNLFIQESTVSSRQVSEGTVEFLDAKLRETKQRIETTEQQIQKFNRENLGKLPEHKDLAISKLDAARAQMAMNMQMVSAKTARLENLKREIAIEAKEPFFLPSEYNGSQNMAPTSAEESVSQLQGVLEVLKTRYSDDHPDVIATKKRLELAKTKVKGGGAITSSGSRLPRPTSPEIKALRREIADVESELAILTAETARVRKAIEIQENDIRDMPMKEQELTKITRDYENLKLTYTRLQNQRDEAAMQRDLITSQKGTQFKVIDPPSKPQIPAGPPREIIAGVGIALALLLMIGLPVMMLYLNSAYKFKEEVEADLGVSVLGIIPPMNTPNSVTHSRRTKSLSIVASTATLALASIVLFFLV
jgi:polysaccharide chain length determinant protein (PEP-CTERM system associated)